jgi:nucleotide-binding universal stress UspA family protein
MLRSVLLPTGINGEHGDMVAFATGLGALGVKRVVLAHIVDTTGLEGPVILRAVDEARGKMRVLAGPLEHAGLMVETRVPTGAPQQEVLALAHETAVDAVVCGSHGRGVVDQLFLGSVSDRVLRHSHVPRLVVRFDVLHNAADPARMCAGFGGKLMLATDFSGTSLRAFEAALELPPSAVGTLYLFHALDPSATGAAREKLEHGAEFQLRNWCGIAAERGMTAKAVIGTGDPVHAILAECDARRPTGLVVGTRGRSPLQEALLGSVSMALVRQASVPVMVV